MTTTQKHTDDQQTANIYGHCWMWCTNDVGDGYDGNNSPGRTGKHRSGHSVEEHGPLCRADHDHLDGLNGVSVTVTGVFEYRHGEYTYQEAYRTRCRRMIEVETYTNDDDVKQFYLTSAQARSLAASLTRAADRMEDSYARPVIKPAEK